MADVVKVGIAGLGRSGWKLHAAALARLPEQFEVVAVLDPREERRAEAEAKFACATFDTFADMAKADMELMVIATPSQFHTEQTIAALQAGKHVLVEKPLARTVAEVDTMIAAARKADRILTVGQNYRYHPDVQAIAEIMASGKLGEIIQIRVAIHQFSRRWDWQTLRENNGGIMANHGAHALDWLLLLFKDEDPEVFCQLLATPLYAGDAESHAKMIIRPDDGPLIDIELTHANAFPQDTYTIMGTQGSLTGTRERLRLKYFLPEHERALELDLQPTADRSYNHEALTFIEEQVELDQTAFNNLVPLYQDLYGTLRQGKPLQITPESVRRQIHVFTKCRESAGWN